MNAIQHILEAIHINQSTFLLLGALLILFILCLFVLSWEHKKSRRKLQDKKELSSNNTPSSILLEMNDDTELFNTQKTNGSDIEMVLKSLNENEEISTESLEKPKVIQDMTSSLDIPKPNITDIDPPSDQEVSQLEELVDLEKKLLALRELYHAKMISTEIYILKTREFTHKIK